MGEEVGRISFSQAPSNPQTLYALVSMNGREGRLYRSGDRGRSWRQVSRDKLRAQYDFCEVRVSPDNAKEVYLPGVRTFKSSDGGQTFTPVGNTVLHLLTHKSQVLHLDTHELWIDPINPDRVLIGNDGGHFDNAITVRIQTGHLKVNPDKVLGAHVCPCSFCEEHHYACRLWCQISFQSSVMRR